MSPVLHTEAPPRVPGDSLRGKRPHDYGRGRVCALPGCTTILRRTHKGPVCDPCLNKDAKARSRASACGPPASAHGEAVTTAAPAVRDNGGRGRVARREVYAASIVDYLSRHEGWSKTAEIARGAEVPKGSMYGLMPALVESGRVELRPSEEGGGYKLRAHSDEVEKSAKTARENTHTDTDVLEGFHWTCLECGKHYSGPQYLGWTVRLLGDNLLDYGCSSCRDGADATSSEGEPLVAHSHHGLAGGHAHPGGSVPHSHSGFGPDQQFPAFNETKTAPDLIPPAPAPVIPPPEQPANEAPASGPLPPQAGLAPFAGIILHELVEGREQDAELRVLTMLDDLDDARRERVLQYAVDRWWLK